LEAPLLLLVADLQPVLDEDDAGLDDVALESRHELQKGPLLLLRREPHDLLDAGAVVPAAVEDHDLPCRREVRHVSLEVELGLLALGRRGEGDDAEDARTHPFGHRTNRPALAGAVAPLEDDDDAQAFLFDPVLEVTELGLELAKLLRVFLSLELRFLRRLALDLGHVRSFSYCAEADCTGAAG